MAAAAAMPFMQALLSTPKGIAALGQTVGVLGKAAGMMIGGKKGAKIAQSAGIFSLVSGLTPSIAGAFKTAPSEGTATTPTGEDLGKATESFANALAIGDITGGVLGKQNLAMLTDKPFGVAGDLAGINTNWTGEGLKINDPNYNSITESFTKDYWK
tara:strand:- start:36 stop:506 length:471 start_codon:yes stop_codon:yes gene_type:complete